ncbi:MAG: ThiF family adenylyltransferase, partial [Chloroflexota bacterium]
MQSYFSRIEPVLGSGLADKRVAWLNLEGCKPVIELLVGCRLRRFVWLETAEEAQQLEEVLRQHNHFEDGWEFQPFSPENSPDLLLVGGSPRVMLTGLQLAQVWQIPALLFSKLPAPSNYEAVVLVCWPRADLEAERKFLEQLPEPTEKLEAGVIAQVAAIAKALLLDHSPYARPDYNHLFNVLGYTVLLLGSPEWPWQVCFTKASQLNWSSGIGQEKSRSSFSLQIPTPKHVAIFGCGGLGSLIAKELNVAEVERFSLLDSGKVQIFHPVRQFYHTSQLGQPKVYALAENLLSQNYSFQHYPAKLGQPRIYQGHQTIASYNLRLNDNWIEALEDLVTEIQPDLAVVTTGTDLDYYLARALQRAKIPYLVARCYPRARYFELIFSLPAEGTPCFDCLRGHLYTGPHPGLTEEE